MTNFHDVLNDAQRNAVEFPAGPLMIIAGPGSGKTRVIAHRIAHLVDSLHVPASRILAVTFTNRAATEMRERVEGLLGLNARDLTMGTFHSICARILRRDGIEIGVKPDFAIYDTDDQLALMRAIQSELEIDPKRFPPRSLLSAISTAKTARCDTESYQRQVNSYFEEIVSRVYEIYQQRLHSNSAVDFDDLLGHTLHLFETQDTVRERYANRYLHTLVDEFQDTNLIQYEIARQLASIHGNIMVVGDPDQSIYSWRSADIRNLQYFKRDFPTTQSILLEQNYRSTGHILSAAHAVIDRASDRPSKSLWTANPDGDLIVEFEAPYGEDEAQFIAGEIRRLIRTTDYQPTAFAVMYRTNAQSRTIEEALIQLGTPYRIVGGTRFYDRREVRDLIAYLRLINNEYDSVAFQRIVNIPVRGIGAKSVRNLLEAAIDLGISPLSAAVRATKLDGKLPTLRSDIRNALANFVTEIDTLSTNQGTLTIAELLDRIIATTNYHDHLKKTDQDHAEVRWENVQELRNVAAQYEQIESDNPLSQFLEEVALVSDIDDPSADQPEAVTLTTLHAAKGLEFAVVFMPGLEEGLLPHIRSLDEPSQLQEERRVCYVGMTRARERLYLTHARRRMSYGSLRANPPSRFLDDLPEKDLRNPVGATRTTLQTGGLRAAAAARQTEQADSNEPSFSPGDRIHHASFGNGIVVACELVPGDQQVTVAFEDRGVKKLLLSLAPIRAAQTTSDE